MFTNASKRKVVPSQRVVYIRPNFKQTNRMLQCRFHFHEFKHNTHLNFLITFRTEKPID